ncbi:methylated-DNA--[protein]-cysteine S-methyltransferase [Rhizobium miluonense]|uniref:Methylated-DNA-[protein]-cysteine S-methyltransferase n=1 Tax=Rhizobium miluonense TaxID=411945 RepID=A0A1C3U629_9HYPH|nr:methylated-DNA--[protein]-cysteine S-methyltransferase [Rhizobium miluonense]SCB10941.1 methylated-DNA-[protein]-cysteine S-methyltransferase [Rhizobium miluonense]
MDLMINKNAVRSVPQAIPIPASADILSYAVAQCELGNVLVARSGKGVCSILLGDSASELTADLASRFPQSTIIEDESLVDDDMAKVLRYIKNPSDGLHLTLDMRGTPFQRRVWEKLKAISVGRTVSYTEFGRWISPITHPRAIARACAANPIALAVPCHRVVRSNGDMASYRWGLERKLELLRKEAAV